ncbi:MAG: polyprenyl synthetase family protein [Cytophagales bacterium]|nr:polyprenyl synthetase family protein [Cytophagales bacterium]
MSFDIQKTIEKLNHEISTYNFGENPNELYDPIEYILSLGGKRIRPLLTCLGSYLFDDDVEKAIMPSLGVEVFHNFSLMHDDIMDKAPLRRGKETVHTKWNDNIAILSGDAMLVKSYDFLLKVAPTLLPEVIQEFNKCACEVCEGQQFDMNFETLETVTEGEYIEMIKLKTAVLLGFALKLGAIIGGADKESAENLYKFGVNIGIGFQLKDDLLDVFGEQSKVGKQVGGDIISNKKTYLLIQALNLANTEQKAILDEWISKTEFDATEKVKAITQIYHEIGIKALAEQKMNEYFDGGFAYLEKVEANQEKKAFLAEFSKSLINREK